MADFVCKVSAYGAFPFELFPIGWNPSIEQESLNIKELEQVLGEKSVTYFKELLLARFETPALRCRGSLGRSFRPGA